MNVLIFVMTMLMLLSLMTYARLDSYRNSQVFQVIFKDYMQEKERGYINTQAEKTYKSVKVKEGSSNRKGGTKIDASPRIGIGLLFDKKRDEKAKEWSQTKILLKNLIQSLYEKQPFYTEIEKERPSFIDELIRSITFSIDGLPDKKKISAVDLANLKLADPQLDRVLYKMLHGAVYLTNANEDQVKTTLKQTVPAETAEAESESSPEDEESANEVDEFKSPEGYYSLLDFVTSSSKPKIRVFLASREVLESIFRDPATVDAIIEERQRLYQQAVSENDVNSLNARFKSQFIRMKNPAIDEDTLDFSVSQTNPKYYK